MDESTLVNQVILLYSIIYTSSSSSFTGPSASGSGTCGNHIEPSSLTSPRPRCSFSISSTWHTQLARTFWYIDIMGIFWHFCTHETKNLELILVSICVCLSVSRCFGFLHSGVRAEKQSILWSTFTCRPSLWPNFRLMLLNALFTWADCMEMHGGPFDSHYFHRGLCISI